MGRRLLIPLTVASLLLWGQARRVPADDAPREDSRPAGFKKANLDLPFDAGAWAEEEDLQSVGVFFCCGKDGTMKEENKWKILQQQVVRQIGTLTPKAQFSLVFFDASVVKFPQSGKPAQASPEMKAAGTAMVMSTQPGSGSCSKPALVQCLNVANQSTARRKSIIYLSDGFQCCPGFDCLQSGKDALAEVTARNTQRIRIDAVCIGRDVDEAWMRSLAQQNGGHLIRLRS